ncbi:hypothetical protein ILYODFUR_020952 [Ilyodon furcidens]|uniref:Uncharacterized protein n=1 Tax=Ilyodon furcidens TaxID=33524 RepID=A0ABV0UV57_9TELE
MWSRDMHHDGTRRSWLQADEMSFLPGLAGLSLTDEARSTIIWDAAAQHPEESAEVVHGSYQDASWTPPIQRFSRHAPLRGEPEQELPGGIIHPIWVPRKGWRMLLKRRL